MAEIQIASGHTVIIDDCDVSLVTDTKWRYYAKCRKWYVVRPPLYGKYKREQYLHRLIAVAASGQIVDHINGDTLDNRRENLRIVNVTQNARNRQKQKKPTASRFKGVCFDKRHKSRPWLASIRTDHGRKHLGQFATEHEAAKAYDAASQEFHGAFGSRNSVK